MLKTFTPNAVNRFTGCVPSHYYSKMRRIRLRILLLLAVIAFSLVPAAPAFALDWCPAFISRLTGQSSATVTNKNAKVYFSPSGGCTEAIIAALASAQNSVLVQAYSFTSAPVAKALVDANRRGVKIQVILDKSNRRASYSSADFLAHAGIPTFIDAAHAIAHNKIMVIDGRIVITGSFNFTKAAEEKNAENLLVIDDEILARQFIENWKAHRQHSKPYVGRPKGRAS
jgi:phosphatidylserine/phosphatidylglycerophosphate/cardiolipin synthase-like enzyme